MSGAIRAAVTLLPGHICEHRRAQLARGQSERGIALRLWMRRARGRWERSAAASHTAQLGALPAARAACHLSSALLGGSSGRCELGGSLAGKEPSTDSSMASVEVPDTPRGWVPIKAALIEHRPVTALVSSASPAITAPALTSGCARRAITERIAASTPDAARSLVDRFGG
jgi:hypothetical protein